MHVLAATNNLFPEPEATGSGRYNYEVGRRLAARGHRVSVLTRRRGDAPARETVAGMDVHRYRASIPRLPWTLRAVARRVRAVERDAPLDVVCFHGALSSFGVDLALSDAVPRTYTVHGLWATEYAERAPDASGLGVPWQWANRALRGRIEGRTLARSDAAVVLSEFMRERVAAAHPDAPPITVLPGGADAERFAPHAADGDGADDASGAVPPAPADRRRTEFLTVRRLTPRMGLDTLVDAFASVVDSGADVGLTVGGDGPLREALEARAAARGVADRVTLAGYVPESDLPATYARADVFVLPTLAHEGFGLATVEALAAGTPVVGTTAGATPEILGPLEDEAAIPERLLVPPGDSDALADALAAWHRTGDEARAAASAACRAHALDAGYTWERVTDRIEALLERVRAGSR
ncbi:glycosyltransferase involved in cell wall biosynthesis [Halarchaeum rubridurum]|uniref:Glycosyltransferase involved in cell wall biosynthesis n=1 Tax=Halarchaeum rubridurum TaxID=489911 RepID=A0A830FKV5_9EURY|nr:glycosyltransferase family 4 protein [Halarchaeum rubridurum]MBP1954377.1 glycosyltransferase involved in cell wall biosynthesis [Halarchaeum rubridurum]GGM60471.1 hypothetical protein GCM10009017_08340 [Halarchaeum rubridurum]